MEYKTFIENILQEVSEIANANFGKTVGTTKEGDNNQVLTETDLAIGTRIIAAVEKKFPGHNIIDEEAGIIDKKSTFTWVVDPIDGTSNFAQSVPLYGIMIGLLENEKPIAGGVSLPFFKEVYVAEKGKGAYCNGQKLVMNQNNNLLASLIAYGVDGHQENPEITYEEMQLLGEIILHIRNLRTSNSVFDMMMVAKGGYGGYLNRTTKIWDNVAPHIILEEAGGIYTDFFGKPMDYSNPLEKAKLNFTCCSGSISLHKQLQEIIHADNQKK